MSSFEEDSFVIGILLLVAGATMAVVQGDPGGLARVLGLVGLGALAACAASRGLRLYLAGVAASLPASVGKVDVRVRPGRVCTATIFALALVLPAAAGVALVALMEWGWLAIAGGVLVAGCGMLAKRMRDGTGDRTGMPP